MTRSQHSTFPPVAVFDDYLEASAVIDDRIEDLLVPAFNEWRKANGVEPAPLPNRPPVTEEAAVAAGKKYKAYWEALEAQTRWQKALRAQEEPRPRKPRTPTLASVAKQASKTAIPVARYEIKPDGTVVIVTDTGEQQQGNELDEWITKHARASERH
jgi:hypothetical protein